mmetsp:Transcript_528/g.1622  ORF Transcript_528/g.1622 Transcript_528/m.1622 type:complete len:287 (+) Transcript_528:1247-2107(+)
MTARRWMGLSELGGVGLRSGLVGRGVLLGGEHRLVVVRLLHARPDLELVVSVGADPRRRGQPGGRHGDLRGARLELVEDVRGLEDHVLDAAEGQEGVQGAVRHHRGLHAQRRLQHGGARGRPGAGQDGRCGGHHAAHPREQRVEEGDEELHAGHERPLGDGLPRAAHVLEGDAVRDGEDGLREGAVRGVLRAERGLRVARELAEGREEWGRAVYALRAEHELPLPFEVVHGGRHGGREPRLADERACPRHVLRRRRLSAVRGGPEQEQLALDFGQAVGRGRGHGHH